MTVILSSIICCDTIRMLCSGLAKLSWIYMKAYSSMKLCEKMLADNDEELDISLIKMEAWFDFRRYILENILPLFDEITNPIISLLILSVIGFTFGWIYQLLVIFDGSTTKFFKSILADNIRFIAFGFTIMIIIANIIILKCLLKPFKEQQAHIHLIQIRKTWLLFDQKQNKIDIKLTENEEKKKKLELRKEQLSVNIEICDHLISRMEKFSSTPSILGYELSETKLTAIRTYIVLVVATFMGTIWNDYVEAYDDIFS